DDIMYGVELGVMLLLGLVVLLVVVRPMVRRIITPDKPVPLAIPGLPELPPGTTITEDGTIKPPESATAKMIDIAQVQGQVHAQSVQKVGDLADKDPNETAAIIRAWLHDAA